MRTLLTGHTPYIMAAFGLAGFILILLTLWVLHADRKARHQRKDWVSDEP